MPNGNKRRKAAAHPLKCPLCDAEWDTDRQFIMNGHVRNVHAPAALGDVLVMCRRTEQWFKQRDLAEHETQCVGGRGTCLTPANRRRAIDESAEEPTEAGAIAEIEQLKAQHQHELAAEQKAKQLLAAELAAAKTQHEQKLLAEQNAKQLLAAELAVLDVKYKKDISKCRRRIAILEGRPVHVARTEEIIENAVLNRYEKEFEHRFMLGKEQRAAYKMKIKSKYKHMYKQPLIDAVRRNQLLQSRISATKLTFSCRKCPTKNGFSGRSTKLLINHAIEQHGGRSLIPKFSCRNCDFEAAKRSRIEAHIIDHQQCAEAGTVGVVVYKQTKALKELCIGLYGQTWVFADGPTILPLSCTEQTPGLDIIPLPAE